MVTHHFPTGQLDAPQAEVAQLEAASRHLKSVRSRAEADKMVKEAATSTADGARYMFFFNAPKRRKRWRDG